MCAIKYRINCVDYRSRGGHVISDGDVGVLSERERKAGREGNKGFGHLV